MWIILFFFLQTIALLRKERAWIYTGLSASYALWLLYAVIEQRPLGESLFVCLLLSVSLAHVVSLRRRAVAHNWTPEEQALREQFFPMLSNESFYTLIQNASWRNLEPGQIFVEEGQPVSELLLIYEGLVTVDIHKKHITRLGAGHFIGEMSFVSGAPASATVRALEPTRCVVWNTDRLHALLFRDIHIKSAFQAMLQGDLQGKLTHREP